MTSISGKVYLVGAGPGPMAYLTVRAQRLLAEADALVYDALIDNSLLRLISPRCESIHVGKRGGQRSTAQQEINQILIRLCQQGKTVIRLKSGDPFIFGRATAEIQVLKDSNCEFEVIPGISSALVAPLLAGIPLTDPVMSHGFGIFTAHHIDALDWSVLSPLETLVFLMGGRNLTDICHQLQRHGKRGECPIAVIRWAGQPQQQIWTGTLLSIAQLTKGERLSPCIIVVGEVVRLRDFLQPTMVKQQPLANKTVLVTRAAGQSSQFTTLLTAQGATVVDMPALEIRPPSSWQGVDDAIARLASFDWLILTSANAVTYFLDRLLAQGLDLRALAGLKIAVVGQKTAGTLKQRGLTPDFIPPNFVADSLVERFPDAVSGLKILFPRVESGGRAVLVKAFTAQGADIVEVAAYESGCPKAIVPAAQAALTQRAVDIVTFASSKTVRHFGRLMEQQFGEQWREIVSVATIASIGPQTTQACQEVFGRVDIEAQEYTLDGLCASLVQWAAQ